MSKWEHFSTLDECSTLMASGSGDLAAMLNIRLVWKNVPICSQGLARFRVPFSFRKKTGRSSYCISRACEDALATYLTLSAPLLWQPVQKRDRFRYIVWRSHTHERDARGSSCKPMVPAARILAAPIRLQNA